MKRIGKIGKRNIEANKKLKEMFAGTEYCEIRLPGCMRTWPLQFCHRHKRIYYRSCPDKLSDYKQVVVGCQACHDKIENSRQLTEEVFLRLRGDEGEKLSN